MPALPPARSRPSAIVPCPSPADARAHPSRVQDPCEPGGAPARHRFRLTARAARNQLLVSLRGGAIRPQVALCASSSENEPCAVYTAGIDGSDTTAVELTCTLKPVCDGANVAWHPDGESLVLTRASGRERQAGASGQIQRSELVQVNLADGRQRVIARIDDWQGDLTSASWSPDGRRLAADHWFSAFHPRPGRRIDIVPG